DLPGHSRRARGGPRGVPAGRRRARARHRARLRRGAPRRARADQGGAGGAPVRFRVHPVNRLAGTVEVPGDKSISHRAALLGALAEGVTEIHGYLEAEDCLRTIAAIQALGADVTRKGPGHYRIAGAWRCGLPEPAQVMGW